MINFTHILVFSLLNILIRGATYYVNSSASSTSPDGTRENPFISLEQVVTKYGSSTAEVILLGSRIFLSGTLTFASGANFTIKPEKPRQGDNYFQLSLNIGSNIRATGANLTFEDIEFIELDQTRTSANQPIQVTDTHLTLRRILVRNINYTTSYQFIRTRQATQSQNPYEFNLIDSQFVGTRNLQMFATAIKLMISGCNFTNITQETAPIILLTALLGPSGNSTLKDLIFQNCVIGNILSGGFIVVISSAINLITDRLTLNNIIFTAGYTFLSVSFTSQSINQTALAVSNWDIDSVYEQPIPSTILQSTGLILNCVNVESLTIINFKANNIKFRSKWMIYHLPASSLFQNKWLISPSINLKNFTISDSTGSIAFARCMDNVVLEDIWLQNTSYFNTSAALYLFRFEVGHKIKIKNFRTKNTIGPLLRIQDFMNQEMVDSELEDTSTSQDINLKYPNIISIERKSTPSSVGLKYDQENITTIKNITIKGFNLLRETEITIYNGTSLMTVDSYFGKVYMKDLAWRNIQGKGISSTAMKYIEMENLTISFDLLPLTQQIPEHFMFEFFDTENVSISKSKFVNNPNFSIFRFYNVKKLEEYANFTMPTLFFQELIVNNNNLNNYDSAITETLFKFYTPFIPIQVTISNCSFQNNKIANGLLQIDEIYKIDLSIINNNFTSNYATETGTIFRASRLIQNLNSIKMNNNTYTNNSCLEKGGLFYISTSNINITAANNSYIGNNARNGGVGYVTKSNFLYHEDNGIYLENVAQELGGSWYLNIFRNKNKSPNFQLSTTNIVNSKAQNGGALYVFTGDIFLSHCSFKANHASISGGDIFLRSSASLAINYSNFSESSAQNGEFFYGESLAGENLIFNDIFIKDFEKSTKDGTLLWLHKGSLKITNSRIQNGSSALFYFEEASIGFNAVTITQVNCVTSQACLIQSDKTDLDFSTITINNIVSNAGLISLINSKTIRIQGLKLADVQLSQETDSSKQLFALNVNQAGSFILKESSFQRFGLSFIKVEESNFELSDTTFTNRLESRILQQTIQNLESAKKTQMIQFLYLYSSNCSITKTSFQENALNNKLNGGALRILGTGGNYQISGCTFDGNQGLNGGAISLEGKSASFKIEKSEFSNNNASYGGAIIFMNQSVSAPVGISLSNFTSNQASYFGGGIYIGDQSLVLENSNFSNNSARQGGGIASLGQDINRISLLADNFYNNSAKQGPALMVFGQMTFDHSTSLFENNSATYGEFLSSKPAKLRLRVYQVNKAFVFVSKISAEYILSHSNTKLVYDSEDPSLLKPLVLRPGVNPNLIFEFTFLDVTGKTLLFFEQGSITIRTNRLATINSQIKADIMGQTEYTLENPTTYIFNTFSVRASFGATVTLYAQSYFFNPALSEFMRLPNLEWTVSIEKCQPGEIYDESNLICSPCSAGTYSFEDPQTVQICDICLDNAICMGGDTVHPIPGYWRIDSRSDRLIECLNPDACLGGERDEGRDISLTGFCETGYEGIACGSCSDGYAKFGTDQICVNCKTDAFYYVKLGGFFLLQIILIGIVIKSHLTKEEIDEAKKLNSLGISTLTKIMIDFIQVLTLILAFNFNWPNVVDVFLQFTTKTVQSTKDGFSIDCFVALIKGNNEGIFYTKVLAYMAQPAFYIIFIYLFWVLWAKFKKVPTKNNPEFKKNLRISMIYSVYVLQPDLLKNSFQLFKYFVCVNFGSSASPKYFLLEDTNEECFTTRHLSWSLAVGIPSLIIWLLLPYVVFAYWIIKKNKSPLKPLYGFVLDRFKEKCYFWELVIMGQKVLIIIISIFVTSIYVQAYLCFILVFILLQLQIYFSPYFDKSLNRVEAISRFCAAIITYSGLYFIKVVLLIVDLASGIIFILSALYMLMRLLKYKIKSLILKLDKALETRVKTPVYLKKLYSVIRTKLIRAYNLDIQIHLQTAETFKPERKKTLQKLSPAKKMSDNFFLSPHGAGKPELSLLVKGIDEDYSPGIIDSKQGNSGIGGLSSEDLTSIFKNKTVTHSKPSQIDMSSSQRVLSEDEASSIMSPHANRLCPPKERRFFERRSPKRLEKISNMDE